MTTTDWVTIDQVIEYLGADAPAADDAAGQARLANSITSSSEALYALSGRKFPGVLTATVRPTARMEQQSFPEPQAISWSSTVYATWGYCCGYPHNKCYSPMSVGLGRHPIVSVAEVIIADEVLDPINYAVEDAKWLVRTDCCGWPTCGCEGCGDRFKVTFDFGEDPPQMGIDAATILSAEMYRAVTPNSGVCRLPTRLTSITRQGVTMAIMDTMDFFNKGMTGIYQVDLFLSAFNPGHQIRKPLVMSPDMINTGKRTTWPVA